MGVNSLISRRLGESGSYTRIPAAESMACAGGYRRPAFVVVGFVLAPPFLGAFGSAPDVYEQAVQYSQVAVGMSFFVSDFHDVRENSNPPAT